MKVLETERMILRPWKVEDVNDFYEYAQNPNVGPNAGWQPHDCKETSMKILQSFIDKDEVWAVEYKINGKVIGSFGAHTDIKRDGIKARMIGYVLSEDYWCKGLMTEAVKEVIGYLFEEKYEVVSCYHYPFNTQSKRVIEKCGFKYEGTLRLASKIYDGSIQDELCYSITREDYIKDNGGQTLSYLQVQRFIKVIEELSMNAWAPLKTKLYDGWVLRFADGYTKRANSINPIYESTIELDKKIDHCEKQYEFSDLPTIFKLTDESYPKGIDKRLEERGYIKIDETSVRILDLSQYASHKPEGVIIETQFSDNWVDAFFNCSKILDEGVQLTARKILGNILGRVICVTKQIDGNIVGCGYGAIERDYIGIFDIVVDKNFRGNGYGQDIMDGILNEAFKVGIKTAYLQVVVGNLPAEKLYNKLGFTEVYRYWYRKLE